MAPIQGPPVEEWHPTITEGILDSAESPYEGMRDLTVNNAWQSSLSPSGTYVTIYAGDEPRGGVLIVWVQDLMAGVEVSHREFKLDDVHPRITGAGKDLLTITSSAGKEWTLDLSSYALTGG